MTVSSGGFPWITLVVFLPLLGVAAILLAKEEMAKWIGLGASLVVLLASLPLWIMFNESTPAMQFVEKHQWIASPSIHYAVGIDGISLPLVLLTTFLTPLCILVSWTSISTRVREFMISLLVMETATVGVFVSLDFVLFYIFWETMLIPMYLLIGVWGGPNRVYAAIKFFLYTLAGSVLLLVAIIVLFFSSGENTFDILSLSQSAYSPTLQAWLFWAFFAAFAVKVPMFPFHTWLPDAHVEAPTAGSIILASVLLKMGTYGFLRFSLPMLPDASLSFTPIIMTLSVIAIIYGAYMAFAQSDLKKLIAYSSVSHMGFVTLGIFAMNAQGIEGAILQMVNHGITTGGLFMCVGIIYERTHSREIVDNSGLAKPMPCYATFLVIFSLSSVGLPGMNSFVGEFFVLVGTFMWSKITATFAALGVILAAAYILWMLQRVVYGQPSQQMASKLSDLNLREWGMLVPLVLFVFLIGLYPKPLLDVMHATVDNLIQQEVKVMTVEMPAPNIPTTLVLSESVSPDSGREALVQ
ncbi:NADH-quinone oxidoreductase subunit M [Candidatus Nitronereus thalassa]|uniref:NADH-quinone oxidoreductase subunit M n=1 Tax=Candidatus Nitronereus thalassa TaxID=3020898 RepID=A0ABU3K5H6_9BACT|nr:NADH-quinone oxidoreductase subunit M [Candidatus Nitronereus thalassa]MDT7041628.1 NADH-quinone oxidoreductase subunit M [Candidatus Nitronereus thalassa]